MECFKKKIVENPLIVQILDAFYDGVAILDNKLNFLYYNNALKEITGLTDAELSRGMIRLTQEGRVKNSAGIPCLENKCKYTTLVKGQHGSRILVTAVPVLNEQDEVIYISVNVRSLTGLNFLGYELEEKNKLSHSPTIYYNYRFKKIRELLDSVDLHDFVVASQPMLEMMETIFRLARYDINILLEGETGVGKTRIAKIIHKFSQRKNNAFVDINVGAIPGSLFESTFFGYEPGAFTGGQKEGKTGIVESAEGGTLFLDEIENLPLEIQGKILKLIDEKRYYKVGGNKILTADIRLIAGSNISLYNLSKEGKFRTDLFYRLNELNFIILPLRERKEDIPALIGSIQNNFLKKYGFVKHIENDAMELLINYNFPGNIRELKNIIENIFLLDDSLIINGYIMEKHLNSRVGITISNIDSNKYISDINSKSLLSHDDPSDHSIRFHDKGIKNIKDKLMQEELEKLLKLYYKHKSTYKVARELGISQATVWRKLRAYIKKTKSDSLPL